MNKNRINKELKKSQLLIAGLFSLFLFIILETTGSIFYFWIPNIEKYFFEKELNILSQQYEEKINQKSVNQSKDIERIKIWDYIVLLDKDNKNNFLVQKWWKNLSKNLKKIVLKNKFSTVNTQKDTFSDEYFFSKSNLKERFFLIKDNKKLETIFTLDQKFFDKYYLKNNFSWIKKFSLNWRKIFIFNKKIFLKSIWKEFNYQAIIPSNIPEKALNTLIFYFQIIILLVSLLSFLIYYFASRKILEPIKISNEKIKKFSDNVWHEIMSPITIISWIAQLTEMWSKKWEKTTEIKLESVEKILESTKKIVNIIETLKKISFLERKNFQLKEKNLWEILKNFLINKKILEPDFEKNTKWIAKQKSVIRTIEKNVSKKIDESIFYLILENLYSNAEKYKSRNSKVKISLTKNKIIVENKIEEKISKSDLKKLKEKFFQADNSRRSKWSGLWLSIIDECLKILWWKIKLFSEEKSFKVEIIF